MSPTVTSLGSVAGALLGTAPYMSPEQARGQEVDERSDIWSFGCVLWECLTGQRLFGGATASDSIGAILHTEPDWARLPADTPPSVQRLLRRCVAMDPRKRLHDFADARLELEDREFEDGEDSSGLPDWEKELVPVAEEIQAGSDRYKSLPEADSRESYHDMELFTGTVDDPSLRQRLEDALDGRGAFSRFRRVLDHHDAERDRWYKFKDQAAARRVRDWLRDLDIEPID